MIERALRMLTLVGWRRGLGGSRPWMVLAIVVTGMRAIRRLGRPDEKVLYRTRLRPGERFVISTRGRE